MNEISDRILLTGAGFTANFGGCLADQMWTRIFSSPEIQKHECLTNLMRNNALGSKETSGILDFESIYSSVLRSNDFNDEEREGMLKAVSGAYESIEDSISQFESNSPDIGIGRCITQLIKPFLTGNSKGFIFTLNQDLFFERRPELRSMEFALPGIGHIRSEWFNLGSHAKCFTDIKAVTISEKYDFQKLFKEPSSSYIKLHGSLNWYSQNNKKVMVIGRKKEDDINKHDLLFIYMKIFKKILSREGMRLLVIGYGFMDEHINKILVESIKLKKLKLYIIDPISPIKFIDRLRYTNVEKGELWNGVCGYFQYKLSDLFPRGDNETRAWKDVKTAFFNDN